MMQAACTRPAFLAGWLDRTAGVMAAGFDDELISRQNETFFAPKQRPLFRHQSTFAAF